MKHCCFRHLWKGIFDGVDVYFNSTSVFNIWFKICCCCYLLVCEASTSHQPVLKLCLVLCRVFFNFVWHNTLYHNNKIMFRKNIYTAAGISTYLLQLDWIISLDNHSVICLSHQHKYWILNPDPPLQLTFCLCPSPLQVGCSCLSCWWHLLEHLAASRLLCLQLLLYLQKFTTVNNNTEIVHCKVMIKSYFTVAHRTCFIQTQWGDSSSPWGHWGLNPNSPEHGDQCRCPSMSR